MTITDINTEFKRYSDYKDSGVKWIEKFPEHWEVESFKNILTERNEKNDPVKSTERLSLSIDKGITLYAEKTTNLDRFKDDFTQYKLAYKGDLVFNSMNMIVGAVGVSDYFGCVSPVYYTYYGNHNNSYTTKFYEYLFRCKTIQGVLYSLGKGLIAIDRGEGKYNTLRLKVAREDLRSLRLPLPNLSEQKAIVDFLDKKIKKIDMAITQKEKLIALLKERKQILIQNSVTKGLDKNAKMKDSGVEWIGEIPEHWDVFEIRRITKSHKQGYYTTEPYIDEGVKLLRITDFRKEGKLDTTECPKVKQVKEVNNYLLEYGDFVFARTGGAGSFAMYDKKVGQVAFASYLIRFRFNLYKVSNYFLRFYFTSKAFLDGIEKNIHGGVNQNIHAEDIKTQRLPTPPINEQNAIVSYIETQSSKIDRAISLQEKQIEKLKEYKSVLIDSAVTGKIKVI